MPVFRYEVVDKAGKSMIGAMDAASESEVRDRLISKGYAVRAVIPAVRAQRQVQRTLQLVGVQRTSRVSAPPSEMAVFFRGMASYLKGGMSAYDALTHIAGQTPNHGMCIISNRLAARVQTGERLSEAMAEFPRAFPPHVTGVVAAGELGGFLPVVIGDVALDYEIAQRASNRWIRWVSQALWLNVYAVILLAPFPLLLFSPGSADLKTGVLQYIHFTLPHVALPLAVLILGYHAGKAVLRQPGMRRTAHSLALRTPGEVGHMARMRSLASFSRILWRLQQAGILPIQAWDAASRAVENVVVAGRMHEQTERIRAGGKFSEALAAVGWFRSEDQRVLLMGETSGQAADVLGQIAAYYEDAAQSAAGRVRWFGLRIAILATILAGGAAVICIALTYHRVFEWVEWFMEAG